MDGLIALVGLVALAVPALVIYLLFAVIGVRRRLTRLEARIADLSPPDEPGAAPEAPAPVADAAAAAPPRPPAPRPPAREVEAGTAVPPVPPPAPARVAFTSVRLAALAAWLRANWFLAVAAVSLALAGVFLVQYGVERGLLTPVMRVAGAVMLGLALVAAGEFLRRRGGERPDSTFVYLPSTFSGAGLVTLFAATVGARQLYDLIGPGAALGVLVGVAFAAVALGWLYGAFLTAIGLVGAALAPFVVGGTGNPPEFLFYHFALVLVAGLLIDAARRWAWVSALALFAGHAGAFLTFFLGARVEHYLLFLMIASAAAIALSEPRWMPRHRGPTAIVGSLMRSGSAPRPAVPVRIAAGGFAASVLGVVVAAAGTHDALEVWLAIAALAGLFAMVTIWCRDAPALADLAFLPPAGVALVLADQLGHGEFAARLSATAERPPETGPPWDASVLAALGIAASLAAFWRAAQSREWRIWWSAGAAALAPALLIGIEVGFHPAQGLGAPRWALHAIAVALVMTVLSERAARADAGTGPAAMRRAAFFAIAAITMISFATMIVLTGTALTLALAVMIAAAAALDRRFDMPDLGWLVYLGAAVVVWRLVVDPGLPWAARAPLGEVMLAYGGSVALLAATRWAILRDERVQVRLVAESAAFAMAAVWASVLVHRLLGGGIESHYGAALVATIWLILAAVKLYRLQIAGPDWLYRARLWLAGLFGALGAVALVAANTLFNPLLTVGERVVGPPVLDSLAVAYLAPALPNFLAARFAHLDPRLRRALAGVGSALVAAWVGLEIRRLWQGPELWHPGASAGEIASYTLAMIVASVGTLIAAFARRSAVLRRLGVAGTALTIAKVFLVDTAGLTGLLRVASFLGLGLSLAGLAWAARWMAANWDGNGPDAGGDRQGPS